MANFIVLDSDGDTFFPSQTVLDENGVAFFVSVLVLDENGIEHAVLITSDKQRNATKPRKGIIKNTSTTAQF